MEDTARRVRELQVEAKTTAEDVEQSKKERARMSLQLKKQKRSLEVCLLYSFCLCGVEHWICSRCKSQ